MTSDFETSFPNRLLKSPVRFRVRPHILFTFFIFSTSLGKKEINPAHWKQLTTVRLKDNFQLPNSRMVVPFEPWKQQEPLVLRLSAQVFIAFRTFISTWYLKRFCKSIAKANPCANRLDSASHPVGEFHPWFPSPEGFRIEGWWSSPDSHWVHPKRCCQLDTGIHALGLWSHMFFLDRD